MLSKSKAMCSANGIEFDPKSFDTIFNNSKSLAVGKQFSLNGDGFFENISNGRFGDMNPQELVTDFATTFKENYTLWVQGQKAKTKNA